MTEDEADYNEEWLLIAQELNVPIEALEFLYDALEFAPSYRGVEPGSAEHSTGRQLCKALPQYACDVYGEGYPACLREWGLPRSEDWGKLVFALVQRGLIQATDEDMESDFASAFDYSDP